MASFPYQSRQVAMTVYQRLGSLSIKTFPSHNYWGQEVQGQNVSKIRFHSKTSPVLQVYVLKVYVAPICPCAYGDISLVCSDGERLLISLSLVIRFPASWV